jgi:hypothetical protein
MDRQALEHERSGSGGHEEAKQQAILHLMPHMGVVQYNV